MDLSGLRRQRESNRRERRRRGATIALASGLLVLLLVMGVFSVASISRSVAQQSSRVHALDEVLKSATIIRAQLGFGIVLSDLDETTTIDASDAVAVAAGDVTKSLTDLENSITYINNDLAGLDSETDSALAAYRSTVEQIRIDGPGAVQPTDELIDMFDRSYDETIRLVAIERDRALEGVADSDADLGRLGTLVNFLVAFVVPTAAFGIYRALTRPETELLVTDAQIVKDTVLRVLRRDLLVREIDQLETAVAELPTPEHLGLSPKDRVAALRRIVLTIDRAHETSFSDVGLNAALHHVAARVDDEMTITISCNDDLDIWSDPAALDVLLGSIIADCQSSGADRVAFSVTADDDVALVRIAKNGMLRSPAELKRLSKQGTVGDRIALLGGTNTAVVSALHLAEDLGGMLDLVDVGDQQSFVLELPMPQESKRSAARALVFGDA